MIKGNKDVFSPSELQPLGCTSAVQHVIKTGDAAPIYKKAYRVPFCQKPVLDKLIQDQLAKGIITLATRHGLHLW